MSNELDLKVEGKVENKEESNVEGGDPKQSAEDAWKKVAEGFESPEALAEAYKKLSDKASKKLSSDEKEFLGQVKEFFGETVNENSKLENSDLKSISNELREKIGVSPRILDAAVAKTAKHVLEAERNNNLADAKSFMSDKLKKQSVEKALGGLSSDQVKVFKSRLQEGKVGKNELENLARFGQESHDPDESFNFGGETDKKQTRADMEKELFHIIDRQSDIWCNPAHPQFNDVNNRRMELKKKLGVL